jgi:hypothetical protein
MKGRGGMVGRSGPPGNLNPMKHGAYSRALVVPAGSEWVAAIVDGHYAACLDELGGEDEVTERKRGVQGVADSQEGELGREGQ